MHWVDFRFSKGHSLLQALSLSSQKHRLIVSWVYTEISLGCDILQRIGAAYVLSLPLCILHKSSAWRNWHLFNHGDFSKSFSCSFHVLPCFMFCTYSAGFAFLSLCFCRFFCFLKLKAINFVNPYFSICQQIMNFKFSILSLPALKPIQPYLRIHL